jgi:hypothetical protein
MAVSGTVSDTVFNTNRVIDNAFRRCRLKAQAITPEMQGYARDALYLILSDIANVKTPSWCVEKQIYPFYEGQPIITLDKGTVTVLNANIRVMQEVTGVTTSLPNSYTVDFTGNDGGVGIVNSVGVKWSAAAVDLIFEASNDGSTWVQVGSQTTTAASGEWTWTDVVPAFPYAYFRITSLSVISATEIYLGNQPQEIPMGKLNRDNYVAQSNKIFQGRPVTYWFQRDQVYPKLNLWPAPNAEAEHQQLILWRHRHIMDVGSLSGEIEVPQRWMEAIIAMLSAKLALQTPEVDANLIPLLDQKAGMAYTMAMDGDNSGSSMTILPNIGLYTR